MGCDLAAGASLGLPANDNRMTVSISGGALEGNQGPLPPDSPGGAILAIGGLSGTKDPLVNRNQLHVSIAGTRFDDNQIGDLQAFGAFSTQRKVVGTYNSVVVELHGISTAADVLAPIASVPKEKEGTNTATILY